MHGVELSGSKCTLAWDWKVVTEVVATVELMYGAGCGDYARCKACYSKVYPFMDPQSTAVPV